MYQTTMDSLYGFKVGDRVRKSARGLRSLGKKYDRGDGEIVGFKTKTKSGEEMECVKVQWDFSIHPVTLHYTFIERI